MFRNWHATIVVQVNLKLYESFNLQRSHQWSCFLFFLFFKKKNNFHPSPDTQEALWQSGNTIVYLWYISVLVPSSAACAPSVHPGLTVCTSFSYWCRCICSTRWTGICGRWCPEPWPRTWSMVIGSVWRTNHPQQKVGTQSAWFTLSSREWIRVYTFGLDCIVSYIKFNGV